TYYRSRFRLHRRSAARHRRNRGPARKRESGLGGAVSKLLIAGGAGFIGANFVLYWRRLYPDDVIIVLDSLTYCGNRANLEAMHEDKQFEFVHADIFVTRLVQSLFRRHDLDFVVHFAAESHVDRSIVSSGAFVRTNVVGTHTLLDC